MVAPERAQSNVLPFQFPVEDLVSTTAYKNFVLEGSQRKKKKYVREDHCDGFDRGDPGRARGLRKEAGSGLFAGFRSLFQGDHLGVEFAVQSHEGLLKGGDASQLGLVVAPPLDLSGHDILIYVIWGCLSYDLSLFGVQSPCRRNPVG